MALIVDQPTCLDCILHQTELSPPDVEAALDSIARLLVLHRGTGTCWRCATEGPVLSLTAAIYTRESTDQSVADDVGD
jgi:hypothetical protein